MPFDPDQIVEFDPARLLEMLVQTSKLLGPEA